MSAIFTVLGFPEESLVIRVTLSFESCLMSSGIFIPSIRTVSPLLNSDGSAWSVFLVLKRSNASMIKSARDSTNSSMKDNEICGDAETLTVPSALTRRFTFFTCFRVRVYVILKPAGVLTARCMFFVDVLLVMAFGDVLTLAVHSFVQADCSLCSLQRS